MTDDSSVTDVTDTAFWVAHFRVKESQRAAPAFRDPLASLLCGDRGRRIARSMPRAAMVEWGVIVRTSAIDRLLYAVIQSGVDTVLNLGAGLDTRPYRMKLPANLRWIEIDLPDIIELKRSKLAEHHPICKLERVGMDLLDRRSRNEMFVEYAMTSKNILVITEGVLSYFSVHDAATLAWDLHATPSIRFWIQDFDNAGQRSSPPGWEAKLKAAPLLFEVKDWFEFFEKYGWRSTQVITSFEEAQRIGRPYPFDFPFGLLLRVLPKAMRQKIHSLSGAVLMQNIAPGVNKPSSRLENSHPASPSLTNGRDS